MQPAFILKTPRGGDRITRALLGRSASLAVVDAQGIKGDTIEVVLDDRDGKIVIPSSGVELVDLYLGYVETGLQWFGRYTIDEIGASAPPQTITLSGKSADMQASLKAPKHGSITASTLGQWVASIADANDLQSDIDVDIAKILLPQLNWRGESDLHTLNRIADQVGAMVKFDKGFLRFKQPVGKRLLAGFEDVIVTRILGCEVTRYDWRAASRTQYKGVRSYYYDKDKAQRIPVTIGVDAVDDGPVLDVRHDSDDAEGAFRAASSRKEKLDKGTASLTLTLTGNPFFRADQIVLVEQLRLGIDGAWSIKSARHQFDGGGGYVTTLECEPPSAKKDRDKATKTAKEYNDETLRREQELKDQAAQGKQP